MIYVDGGNMTTPDSLFTSGLQLKVSSSPVHRPKKTNKLVDQLKNNLFFIDSLVLKHSEHLVLAVIHLFFV